VEGDKSTKVGQQGWEGIRSSGPDIFKGTKIEARR